MERRAFYIFLAILTGARLWVAARIPMQPEDGYLSLLAGHFAGAYFDETAGWPWLAAMSEMLLGGSPLGVRFFAPILAALGSWILFEALVKRSNPRAALAVGVLLNLIPLFNQSALFPSQPVALVTILSGLAWALHRAGEFPRRADLSWILAGLLLGIGVFFSPIILCLWPVLLTFPFLERRTFSLALRPGFYVALVLPILAVLPAWLWNRANDWPWFIGTTRELLLSPNWQEVPGQLTSLLSTFTPVPLFLMLLGLPLAIFLAWKNPSSRLALALAVFPLFPAAYFLARGQNPSLWLLLAGIPLLGLVAHAAFQRKKWPAWLCVAALVATLIPSIQTQHTRLAAKDNIDWNSLAERVENARTIRHLAGEPPLFLIASDAGIAAMTGALLTDRTPAFPGHPLVYVRESQALQNQFALLPRYDEFVESPVLAEELFTEQKGRNLFLGRHAIYISPEAPEALPQAITGAFESVEEIELLTLPGAQTPSLRLYLCRNYQTLPL